MVGRNNNKEADKKILDVLGYTNVHVDFHTPRFHQNVGSRFDPDRYAEGLKKANVDSITFFANCYHGYSYYNTKVGTKHPHLIRDLLPEVLEGCHKNGIRVLAYLSIALDSLAAKENPAWVQEDKDGSKLMSYARGWLCLNSPYPEEVLVPQVKELLDLDIDGFFFDELFYHPHACYCSYCKDNMKRLGMDPEIPEHMRVFLKRTCDGVAERTTAIIANRNDALPIIYNPSTLLMGIMGELSRNENVVLVGGHEAGWGGIQFPLYHRYVRNLDRPVLAMTGIFYRKWGDFGTVKHDAQRDEVAEQLSHHFRISIGDHLRPDAEMVEAKYKVIGKAFDRVRKLSLPEATPVRDIAVLYPGEKDYRHPTAAQHIRKLHVLDADGANGATKVLCETHQQFDIIDEDLVDKIDEFNVLILPETGPLQPHVVERIRKFVEKGGSLLATGNSSLSTEGFALGDVLGIRYQNKAHAYSRSYLRLNDYSENIPDLDCAIYGDFLLISSEGSEVKGGIVAPCGGGRLYHPRIPGPPGQLLDDPAITYHEFGSGRAIYIGTDIFSQCYEWDYWVHRNLLDNVINSLQEKRVLNADAPSAVWVNAMQSEQGIYVHMLNYYADRQAGVFPRITSAPPKMDITIILRSSAKNVTPVTDLKVDYEHKNDCLYIQCLME